MINFIADKAPLIDYPWFYKDFVVSIKKILNDKTSYLHGDAGEVQRLQSLILRTTYGGASYCGTVRLQEACLQMELSVKEEKKELFTKLYEQLLAEIKAVEEAVKNKNY